MQYSHTPTQAITTPHSTRDLPRSPAGLAPHRFLEHLDEHPRPRHREVGGRVARVNTRVGRVLSGVDELGAKGEQDRGRVDQAVRPVARERPVEEEDDGDLQRDGQGAR